MPRKSVTIKKSTKKKTKKKLSKPPKKDKTKISASVLLEDFKKLTSDYKSLNFLNPQIKKIKRDKVSFKDLAQYFRLAVLALLDEIGRIQEQGLSSVKLKTVSKKEEEVSRLEDNLRLLKTDYDNLKRRTDKLGDQNISIAGEQLVLKLLPIIDNFDRAIVSAENINNLESILKGITMIRDQMSDILNKEGLKEIHAEGSLFDPTIHEAIGVVEGSQSPPDTVIEVIRRGYFWHNKLLRPAQVKIARKSG